MRAATSEKSSKGLRTPAKAPRTSGLQDSPENPLIDLPPFSLDWEKGGWGGLGRQKTARRTPAKAPRTSGLQDSPENPLIDLPPFSLDWEKGGWGGLGRQKTARRTPAKAPRISGLQDSPENPHEDSTPLFPLIGKRGLIISFHC